MLTGQVIIPEKKTRQFLSESINMDSWNEIKIFRAENIPLIADLSVKEQKYGEIAGAMTIEEKGKTLTLQQAGNFLKDPHRPLRDEVYHKIKSRRMEDRKVLDELFSELV